jgi:hypothetical protein
MTNSPINGERIPCPACDGRGWLVAVRVRRCSLGECRQPVAITAPGARQHNGLWYHDICLKVALSGKTTKQLLEEAARAG